MPSMNAPSLEGKASPVTGRGGPRGCVTSGLKHFPDNLSDGD
jgi:hypothetical protein